jgi:hypothetical protein
LAFENRKSSASEGYRELRSAFEVRKLLNRKIVEQGAKRAFAKRNLSAPSRSGLWRGWRGHFTRIDRRTRRLIFRRNIELTSFRWNFCASLGHTKLVDPDATSAFELGSGNGFTSQQCIPDQLGIGLGVDHGLEEFSSQPDRKIPQHLFQQAMWDASGMQTELLW